MTTPCIEDYALLGDCRSAALVSKDGSVDWFCVPRFDSGAVFAAILGDVENGRWKIAPSGPDATAHRAYRPGTMVLETEWTTPQGRARVVDFMPVGGAGPALVRMVEGIEGEVTFDLDLVMRFDYGLTVPWVRTVDDTTMTATSGATMLSLRCNVEMKNVNMHSRARFAVRPGKEQVFCLAYQISWEPLADPFDPLKALDDTAGFWRDFAGRCPRVDGWTELVERSLLTLKALTFAPTGGMVAAPTTSLPETIGGGRNWDYRYCWLRDSSMMLMAFLELGYLDEAVKWRDWLLRAIAGDPAQTQIMYGVAGERITVEWEADWLAGFRDSRPVRIGNAAADQLQLDVYGEVAEMLNMAREGGLKSHDEAENLIETFLPYLERSWHLPDDGIWETRSERQHYVHSKVMCWVAFDRGSRQKEAPPEKRAHWREVARRIHAEVCKKGFDKAENTFVQSYGSKAVDASLLQIALTGFLPADDPRVAGTVAAIERHLMPDGLVMRYDATATDDGVSTDEEGTFLICTFWLIDTYVLMGRREDARRLFDRVSALVNDVGLLAEEYDTKTGRMLGNFPQAFSHVGLILSALNLSRDEAPVDKRACAEPETQEA
ncbi:glycosyl hydrolase, family 15 [Oceaniovalibus guishaninsula JLT2003]|uniref:Glycosyl hydrolase, family 15 n=1 Tax=Oceaniovalibus guishaninsula JLT2003 TaxID=1231392 RepID=K2GM58_9RHOB|nr:glycoside hydrolase family 15 protein [Oceaniovalibus guishaninsula]EKE43816.1 glycosyl hydrolase, family 15 [Oceaniovalibus guishaninsula JLT2003]